MPRCDRTKGTGIYVPPPPKAPKAPVMSKSESRFLLKECLSAERQIRAGNRDRYLIGRRSALVAVIARLMRITQDNVHKYMDFLHGEVVLLGKSIADVEEPGPWVYKQNNKIREELD